MSIHLFTFEDNVGYFASEGYDENFSEIYDQLYAEYLFGGFNEQTLWGFKD